MGESNGGRPTKLFQRATFPRYSPRSTRPSPGTFPGTVRSRATSLATTELEGFFQRTMELSKGAFGIDLHNVLTDGDLVVVLITVKAQRNGVSASFPEVHVWRLNNGKATEFREYQGAEQREDRFWS